LTTPDDGTTDFRVGGLRDLLEGGETGPAKGGGGGRNRQLAIIGGAAAVVIVVLVAVLLLAGGGGDGDGDGVEAPKDAVPVGIEMKPSAAAGVEPGIKASICDSAAGPVAEGVVVTKVELGKSAVGQEKVTLTVLASGDDINELRGSRKSTWYAIARDTCPPVTTTPAPPATEPAPAPTPPDSTPTPPPS
jgi:hypothetical protein